MFLILPRGNGNSLKKTWQASIYQYEGMTHIKFPSALWVTVQNDDHIKWSLIISTWYCVDNDSDNSGITLLYDIKRHDHGVNVAMQYRTYMFTVIIYFPKKRQPLQRVTKPTFKLVTATKMYMTSNSIGWKLLNAAFSKTLFNVHSSLHDLKRKKNV